MTHNRNSHHDRLLSVLVIVPMLLTLFLVAPPAPSAAAAPVEAPAASVLQAGPSLPIWQDPSYSYEERAANLVSRLTLAQKAAQMVSSQSNGGASITVDGVTIPGYGWWNEALHGVSCETRNTSGNCTGLNNTTSYPIDLAVAASWDPEVLYREASMISDEAREVMRNNTLDLDFYSPTVNLSRDPRWGRNDESYGEDPLLAAAMAAQFVNGMEGKDMNGNLLPEGSGYYKTLTTLKHYELNNSEYNRLGGNAVTDDRALREYYTSVYRKIVQQAQPASIMSSYNSINGVPSSANTYMNINLMRQTFGFGGYFTSDCNAVKMISAPNWSGATAWTPPGWSAPLNAVQRNAFAITGGEDLECNAGYNDNPSNYRTNVPTAVAQNITTQTGRFTENDVDAALVRLFTARMKLGEFDNIASVPWVTAARSRVPAGSWVNSNSNNAITETPARLAMARETAAKSLVLLKNSPVAGGGTLLPLQVPASGAYKVLVIGALGNNTNFFLGGYSSAQGSAGQAKEVTPYNGLKAAVLAINPGATVDFARGFTGTSNAVAQLTTIDTVAVNNAANYDRVIVYVGTDNDTSREDRDRTTLVLPGAQAALISQVAAKNPNTIAVLETTGVVDVTPFEPSVSAMLYSSFNGMRKGEALADVLLGAYNPSGHLPFIWYPGDGTNTSVIPAINDYTLRPTGTLPGRTYMYYTGPLSYPFGWGLSYTTFSYSNLQIDKHDLDANDTVNVSVDVTNTGLVAGSDVVQLYFNTPGADPALQRPIKRLEGFQKVSLNPGETKTVTLAVKVPDLAFFDQAQGKWAVDNGAYGIQISTSSADADIQLQDLVQVMGSINPVPSVVTVQPTQQGDAANDIPVRLLFLEDKVVVPNITVAMNDDTLYGYILKGNSKPFPAGMEITYSSNRPEVVSVDPDGTIRTTGGGVATLTATATYGGVSKSAKFVIHVQADTSLSSITLDGQPMVGFSPTTFAYNFQIPDGTPVPVVAATASSAKATVDIVQAAGIPGTATITITSGAQVSSYTISFTRKPNDTTLTDIQVNGQALTAYSPTVFTYTGIVPGVVTAVPVVAASANNPAATVTIAQAPAIPGAATVTVTAAPDVSVYTVNFIRSSGGSDEFDSATQGSQWSWVRQNASTWSLTSNPGSMTIQAENGDLYTTTNNAKNLLLQNPASDWTIDSKLVYNVRPHAAYQQGGILVYLNDDNYIKMDWESTSATATVIQRIVELNGSVTSVTTNGSVVPSSGANANTIWLRIVKSGSAYRSFYSVNGTTFAELGASTSPAFAASLGSPRVGLYSNNGSGTTTDLKVSFDYFRLANVGQVIKGLQTITFPAISDKVYLGSDFDPAATASSGLAVSYSASGNCSIVSGKVRLTGGAGSCTVTASQVGDANWMPAVDVSQSFNIAKAATTTTVDPATVQYSDQVTLWAHVAPPTTTDDAPTGTAEFFVNGISVGSAPIDVSGAASVNTIITAAPGTHNITAAFTSTNVNYADSTAGPAPLTVTEEDARAYYNGNALFWTTSVNSTSANVTLSASILDMTAADPSADANAGDIRNARVSFINRDTNTVFPGCSNLPVGLVNAGDLKTGVATCNIALTADKNTGASQYTVGIVVSGYYMRSSTDDDTIITVAQPIVSNFITGGGYVVLSNSAGMTAGDPGSKTNFGFNVKYNKGGTNLQGNARILIRSGGHVYQVKTNALSSFGVVDNTANFSSKASIQDVTNPSAPVSVEGNATLQLWLTDNGEPGTADTIGIQVLGKSGGVWFSSNWSGIKTVEQVLGGGNVAVH